MKPLIVLILIAGLFLLPMAGFSAPISAATAVLPPAQPNMTAVKTPPVAQPLVREGDFAVRLAGVLNLGTPQSEGAAESMLASIGIAPSNGWIGDYPVTPEIIGQLQNAIEGAVRSGKLPMSMPTAMAALQTASKDFGLNIALGGASSNQAAGEPAPGSSVYSSPAAVDNYYYDYGPPVITYYSPPPAYFYLYAWVPAPFWCAGFYFPGFFMLDDFDTFVVVHHRREICTNHVFNPRTKRFFFVNPVNGKYYRSVRDFPHFNRPEARKGGEAIYQRAWAHSRISEHGTVPKAFAGRNLMSSGSGERFQKIGPPSRGSAVQPMNRSREESHFFGGRSNLANSGHREVFGPPSRSERSYSPPSSMESHGRPGSFGNEQSLGGFHGAHFAGIPHGGMEHGGLGGGFHGGNFAGAPHGGMEHGGLGGGFHGGGFNRG
jgi:hypothetical protein